MFATMAEEGGRVSPDVELLPMSDGEEAVPPPPLGDGLVTPPMMQGIRAAVASPHVRRMNHAFMPTRRNRHLEGPYGRWPPHAHNTLVHSALVANMLPGDMARQAAMFCAELRGGACTRAPGDLVTTLHVHVGVHTPVHAAVVSDNPAMWELVRRAAHGDDGNGDADSPLFHTTTDGRTAAALAVVRDNAVMLRHILVAARAAGMLKHQLGTADHEGLTPAGHAALHGDSEHVVTVLLEFGARFDKSVMRRTCPFHGPSNVCAVPRCPVHVALRAGNTALLERLATADPPAFHVNADMGRDGTLLNTAAAAGDASAVTFLITRLRAQVPSADAFHAFVRALSIRAHNMERADTHHTFVNSDDGGNGRTTSLRTHVALADVSLPSFVVWGRAAESALRLLLPPVLRTGVARWEAVREALRGAMPGALRVLLNYAPAAFTNTPDGAPHEPNTLTRVFFRNLRDTCERRVAACLTVLAEVGDLQPYHDSIRPILRLITQRGSQVMVAVLAHAPVAAMPPGALCHWARAVGQWGDADAVRVILAAIRHVERTLWLRTVVCDMLETALTTCNSDVVERVLLQVLDLRVWRVADANFPILCAAVRKVPASHVHEFVRQLLDVRHRDGLAGTAGYLSLDAPARDGTTAVWWAARRGLPLVLEYLLDAGAHAVGADAAGHGVLYAAAAHGHAMCVKMLLGRVDVPPAGISTRCTWTPAGAAAIRGHVSVLKVLLRTHEHAHLSVSRRVRGVTVLHVAAAHGHADIIRFVTDLRPFTPVDVADARGNTPLGLAAIAGHADAVRALLAAGAAPAKHTLAPVEWEKWGTYRAAASGGTPPEWPASESEGESESEDEDGVFATCSPLNAAVIMGCNDVVGVLAATPAISFPEECMATLRSLTSVELIDAMVAAVAGREDAAALWNADTVKWLVDQHHARALHRVLSTGGGAVPALALEAVNTVLATLREHVRRERGVPAEVSTTACHVLRVATSMLPVEQRADVLHRAIYIEVKLPLRQSVVAALYNGCPELDAATTPWVTRDGDIAPATSLAGPWGCSTLLHLVAKNGMRSLMILAVADEQNLGSTACFGVHPAVVAAHMGHTDVLRLLIQHNVDMWTPIAPTADAPQWVRDLQGCTPYEAATRAGHTGAAWVLRSTAPSAVPTVSVAAETVGSCEEFCCVCASPFTAAAARTVAIDECEEGAGVDAVTAACTLAQRAILHPCKHASMCAECALSCTACPVCRKRIYRVRQAVACAEGKAEGKAADKVADKVAAPARGRRKRRRRGAARA